MVKKIEKLFKSYRDQLLHLAKIYGVVEVKSYARSSKRLTISQLELLLIKNKIKLPINRSSDKALAKQELRENSITNIGIIKTVEWDCWATCRNNSWCLLGCAIGDFGTFTFFQFAKIYRPTIYIMSLAVFNGLLTSIALETTILTRQVALKIAFKTALGMSMISMVSMEFSMN